MSQASSVCPAPERLFDLVESGDATLRAHVDGCDDCARLFHKARRIHEGAAGLRDPVVDDDVRAAIWRELAPAASRANQRITRRNAWRVIAASPYARVGAVAATVALLAGVLLFALLPGPVRISPAAPEVATPAPDRSTAAVAPSPAAKPPVRSSASPPPMAPVVGTTPDPGSAPRPGPGPRPTAIARPRMPVGGLACGARILRRRGQVRIETDRPDAARIRLASGELTLHVPRLGAGRRVEVVTPDARVRVKGTRFTVRSEAGGRTTVSVAEGVVWIYPTGRKRQVVVLGSGDRRSVLGEAAYLGALLKQLGSAVAAGDLHQVVRMGRRYLAVTTRPRRTTSVRMQLAGALEKLGRRTAAAAEYRTVARHAAQPVSRQNALAYLARLQGRAGKRADALATWGRLLRRYPSGLHTREALLALVRATCQSAAPAARARRRRLAERYPRDPAVADALRGCRGQPSP